MLAGYSQGGYVVHGAIFLMPPEALEFVAAGECQTHHTVHTLIGTHLTVDCHVIVQVFGDPMEDYPFGDIPTDKVNVDCHWLDVGTPFICASHPAFLRLI